MADAIATLGLQVDNTGALTALKQFDAATTKTATTATAAATQVATATKKVTGATDEEVKALVKQQQELTKAENVRRRAERALRDYEAAQRAQTVQSAAVSDAAVKVVDTTKQSEAAFNRIRGSLTGLMAPILGTVGGFNALSSTLGSLAVGNAVTVGLLAGVAAIGLGYEVLTKKTRELQKAQDDALKSLEALAKAQRQGVGGELAEQIGLAAKNLARLKTEAAALTAQRGSAFGGAGPIDRGTGQRSASDVAAELTKRNTEIAAAERELAKIIAEANRDASAARTAELASLKSSNAATVAETAEATKRLATLQGQLAASVASGGDPAERIRLVEDIKKLNDALNPEKVKADAAAKRDQAAALRELAKEAKEAAKILAGSDDAVAGLNAGFARQGLAALDAAEKQRAVLDQITAKRKESVANAQEEIDALQHQVDLIGKTKEQQQGLIDLEVYRLAIARGFTTEQADQLVTLQRTLRENADATKSWADSLQAALGIVQLLASSFGDVGREIAKAASGAQSIASGASAFKSASNATEQAGAIGTVAGGVFVLVDALNSLDKSQERAAKHAEDLQKAFDTQITSVAALGNALSDTTDLINGTVEVLKASALQALTASLRASGGDSAQIESAFTRYEEALRRINELEDARTKRLEEQARALNTFSQNNEVLRLRLDGRDSEADAAQVQIDIMGKVADATARFGNTAEVAEYALLLFAQAAKDAAEAEEERIRELARKVEEERRSIFDLNNGVLGFTDSRAAGQAAFDESLVRRYNDAVERGASAAELAAIALYNVAAAADYAAQLLEQDTRTTESLIARILSASGDARGAEDATFAARQRQEMADAIRAGMSESNLALLRFTQMAERSQLQMQRAIEDGTKAILADAKNQIAAIDLLIEVTRSVADAAIKKIDEQIETTQALAKATAKAFDAQISAIREQTKAQLDAIDAQIDSTRDALDAANKQVAALDKVVQTNTRVVEALTAFSDSLKLGDLSPLSPEQKLAEARSQFETLAAAAAAGDANAATQLPGAAQSLLQASRGYNASGAGFVEDYNRVQSVIAAITQQFGATLPIDMQTLEAAKATVEALQQSLDALNDQKEVIQSASDAQIAILQAAKDKAAEDAQRTIDKLNEEKDAINENTRATLDKLDEQKDAINAAAQAQIEQLIKLETEAHMTRLRQDEYWQTFLGYTNVTGPTLTGEAIPRAPGVSAPVQVAQDQLAETKRSTELLVGKLDIVAERLERITNVSVQASDTEVTAVERVERAIGNLTTVTRDVGQATAARINSRR